MTNLLRLPYTILRPLYERTSIHRSVIEELTDQRLKKAYTHCRLITRNHAKTFYMATRFLPNRKQRAIFAIYGLCRYLDDLVDEAEDLMFNKKISCSDIEDKLQLFRDKLIRSYNGKEQSDPILIAFSDVLSTYNISIDLPLQLIEGVEMDLRKNRYNSFSEVYDYSYKVASVVGLMTSEVFGYSKPEALDYAIDLGIAMQLTNILRDVGEDIHKNRIYLPLEELKKFNVSETDFIEKNLTNDFKALIHFQIERAREYYERADKGISMLDKDSRLPVALASENYSRILNKIEENDYKIFEQRAYLNSREKFYILPKVMYKVS